MDALMTRAKKITFSIPWNLALLTIGAFLVGCGIKALMIPNAFLPSGISGLGLLAYYIYPKFSSGTWILMMNIPVFIIGFFFINKKFFFYSLYGMVMVSFFTDLVPWSHTFHDKWLAVLASGITIGTGAGIALRSFGSVGGVGILQILFREKFGIKAGQLAMSFNCLVMGLGLIWLNLEDVLYSMAMIFINATVIDKVQTLFNQRRMALIVTKFPEDVSGAIMTKLGRGTTLMNAKGGFTGEDRTVIMTVVDSFRIKKLEATVFTVDPNAFMIIESTFSVTGKGFSGFKG